MKYLFSYWGRIRKTLKDKFVYLFLDYDGTLSPIAETPDKAVIPDRTKDILFELAETPNCKVAVISGRALKDISRRVGIKNIVYAGNHGLEIKGPNINFKDPVSSAQVKTIKEVKAKLKEGLSPIKGVLIEDKGLSLSVHYRLADKENMPAIMAKFYTIIFPYEFANNIQVRSGKMVLEIRPPVSWDKGTAVLWLLGKRPFEIRGKRVKVIPIYIGDDATDEDAFKSLKDKGITVSVGKSYRGGADFYLKDTEEMPRFLEAILKSITPGAPWRKKG